VSWNLLAEIFDKYNMVKGGMQMKTRGPYLDRRPLQRDNCHMKRVVIIAMVALFFAACSPVLNRELMEEGAREFSLAHLRETPEVFEGKLFILGGLISETKLMEPGSQIEAIFVPVNSYGHLKSEYHLEGRFLAVYPKSKGILDPLIYKRGREITVAGEFAGLRKSKIDEMEYVYPLFEIKQIYLWEERKDYYRPYYYPYYYPYYGPYPYWYDPWWGRPYPGPYWPPPW
jgi:outer membrane lipoprotein